MTAVPIVLSVTKRLEHLLTDEINILQDLKEKIKEIQRDLSQLRGFLEKFYGLKRRDLGDDDNKIVSQITELCYEVENTVESYASKPRGRLPNLFRRVSVKAFLRDLEALRNKIYQKYTVFSQKPAPASINGRLPILDDCAEFESNRPSSENSIPVEEAVTRDLLEKERGYSVISIWGMGGIGKTTLVKKLYENQVVSCNFECFAWVSLHQEFKVKNLMRMILLQLLYEEEKNTISKLEDLELAQLLFNVQQKRKCLLVLDDVWSEEDWQRIRVAFPISNSLSKILLTTRNKRVAEAAAAARKRVYQVKLLDDKQSWELFKRNAYLDDHGGNQEFEKTGRQIIRKCGVVPIAIIITGKMLRGKSLVDWKSLLEELDSFTDKKDLQGFQGQIRRTLHISYYNLPHHLKPCFLYLGLFHDAQEIIQVDKLQLLLMAEGLISSSTGKNDNNDSILYSCEDYLEELARSCMIELKENKVLKSRKYKSCKMHDLIRDLCIHVGKAEEFLDVIGFEKEKDRFRRSSAARLAISLHNLEDGNVVIKKKHVRSLLIDDSFNASSKSKWPGELFDLKEFRSLIILDFNRVNFRVRQLPKGISQLFLLRYLSFRHCYLDELPSFVSNFPYLETLDLRVIHHCTMTIPNILWKIARLRHLFFPLKYLCTDPRMKLELGNLTELEILENFNTSICEAKDLLRLNNIRILSAITAGDLCDLKVIIKYTNICSPPYLNQISLDVRDFDCYSKERIQVVKQLLENIHLHGLRIQGYLSKLPEELKIATNFTEMVLNGSELLEDPMPILGMLLNLRRLVLCNDAYTGKQMTILATGFLELRSLELLNLHNLEKWTVERGGLPNLYKLYIQKCPKLETQPEELKSISSLEKLKIVPK